MHIQNVTIFTDASFKNGYVGGGYWIIYGNHQRITGTVNFIKVPSVSDAELLVSLYAIDIAINHPEINAWMKDCNQIRMIIVTDAMSTKHTFEKEHCGIEMLNKLKNVKRGNKDMPLLFKVNHVKAHTRDKSARSYVNRWCDEHARIARLQINSTTAISPL